MSRFNRQRYVSALQAIMEMVEAGASAETVAAYVRCLDTVPGVAVSMAIEDAAAPGTFAEAVFNILAD